MKVRKSKIVQKAANLAIAMALILATLFMIVPNQTALAAECAVNHVVTSGETISSIAVEYDVDWQEIAAANNLKDPYTIFINQTLCIPASTTSSSSSSSSSSSTTSSRGFDLTRDATRI